MRKEVRVRVERRVGGECVWQRDACGRRESRQVLRVESELGDEAGVEVEAEGL